MSENRIKLWDKNIPLYDESIGQMPELEPYLVENPKACILVIPGGGYTWLAYEHEGIKVAKEFNRRGFSAFILTYRIKPYKHPVPLTDGLRAIRVIRSLADKYGYDQNKIAAVGFSAGGHLTACLATMFDREIPKVDEIDEYSSRPDLAMLSYAVIDYVDYPTRSSARYMLGENAPFEMRAEFSPNYNVKENTPPTFIWHTEEDSLVSLDHPIKMAEALFEKKVPCELHIFPYGDHGLGVGTNDPSKGRWVDYAEMFMKKYLNF